MEQNEKACLIIIALGMFTIFIKEGFAQSWVAKQDIEKNNVNTFWTRRIDCEVASKNICIEVPANYNQNYFGASYKAKTDIVKCANKSDCQTKMGTDCTDGRNHRVMAGNYKSVYCTRFLGISESQSKKRKYISDQKKAEQLRKSNLLQKQSLRKQCLTAINSNQNMNDPLIKACFRALL